MSIGGMNSLYPTGDSPCIMRTFSFDEFDSIPSVSSEPLVSPDVEKLSTQSVGSYSHAISSQSIRKPSATVHTHAPCSTIGKGPSDTEILQMLLLFWFY